MSAEPSPRRPALPFAVPRLMVSVRDLAEAREALAGGAKLLDLKEPQRGPLGAPDYDEACRVAAEFGSSVPVSAAAGELIDWPRSGARRLLEAPHIGRVKLGLAGCRQLPWQNEWQSVMQQARQHGKELVAVCYADADGAAAPPLGEVIEAARRVECEWLLIDTFDKSSGRLIDIVEGAALRSLLADARESGMRTVVAGSLRGAEFASLPLELIDVVAVRGSASRGDRLGAICRRRVSGLVDALAAACTTAAR